jgi:hypothetical protein
MGHQQTILPRRYSYSYLHGGGGGGGGGVYHSPVQLPTSAGSEQLPVSASQEASTVAPELPTCEHELSLVLGN